MHDSKSPADGAVNSGGKLGLGKGKNKSGVIAPESKKLAGRTCAGVLRESFRPGTQLVSSGASAVASKIPVALAVLGLM